MKKNYTTSLNEFKTTKDFFDFCEIYYGKYINHCSKKDIERIINLQSTPFFDVHMDGYYTSLIEDSLSVLSKLPGLPFDLVLYREMDFVPVSKSPIARVSAINKGKCPIFIIAKEGAKILPFEPLNQLFINEHDFECGCIIDSLKLQYVGDNCFEYY